MKEYMFRPILTLLLLVAAFFPKEIFSGSVFYCCDNLLINIPSKLFLVDELRQGRFPLWNPYLFSGSPFLADLNLALLYPLNVLYFLLPAFGALTVGVIANFMIALTGMYVFARSIKLSRFGSILGAIVFGFSGTMVTYTNNVPMLQVASLMPWVVWSVHRYLLLPQARTLLVAVASASLQIIAGHPQLTFYTWLLVAGCIVWELTGSRPVMKQNSNGQGETLTYTLIRVVFLIGVVFLLTAVQVLPFLEFVRLSTRIDRGFDYASFDSLHPLSLIRLIIPNVVGVLRDGTAWARGGSVYGYTGIISLLLALLVSKKNRYVRFFFICAVVSLLLAFGKYTPLFRLAYFVIPGVGSFRSPQHFLLLYTFSIAVLAGFGLDGWKDSSTSFGTTIKKWLKGIGVVGGIGGIVLLSNTTAFPGIVAWLGTMYPTRVLEKLHGMPADTIETIVRLIAQNILITSGILFVVALLFARRRRLKPAIAKTCFIGLIFVELFLFSRNNLLSAPNNVASKWLTIAQEKAVTFGEVNWQQYRSYTDPAIYPYQGKKQFGVFDWDKESEWQATILRPNLNMVAHLPAIDGYASLIYADYAHYLNKKQVDPTGVLLDDPTGDKKRRLGVVPDGLPRLFLVGEGNEATEGIEMEKYTPNEAIVTVAAEQPARLVFVDTNYPGWEVFMDGKRTLLLPFEDVFKSVEVQAGTHRVVFRFFPLSVRLGAVLSLAGIVGCLLLTFVAIRRSEVPKAGATVSSRGRRSGEKRLKRRI